MAKWIVIYIVQKKSKAAAILAIKENEEIGDEGENDSEIDD